MIWNSILEDGESGSDNHSEVNYLTGVSPFWTGGAYSGSSGSTKLLTNWAIPSKQNEIKLDPSEKKNKGKNYIKNRRASGDWKLL